jgi:hypothetical protein
MWMSGQDEMAFLPSCVSTSGSTWLRRIKLEYSFEKGTHLKLGCLILLEMLVVCMLYNGKWGNTKAPPPPAL